MHNHTDVPKHGIPPGGSEAFRFMRITLSNQKPACKKTLSSRLPASNLPRNFALVESVGKSYQNFGKTLERALTLAQHQTISRYTQSWSPFSIMMTSSSVNLYETNLCSRYQLPLPSWKRSSNILSQSSPSPSLWRRRRSAVLLGRLRLGQAGWLWAWELLVSTLRYT